MWGLTHPADTFDCPGAMRPHNETKDCLQRVCRGWAISGIRCSEMACFACPTPNRRARGGVPQAGRGQAGSPGGALPLAAVWLLCVPLTPSDTMCRKGACGEHGSPNRIHILPGAH